METKQRITLFGALEIFFDEARGRVGSPSPTFWRALRKIWKWITVVAIGVESMHQLGLLKLPEVSQGWVVLIAGAISWLQTYLAKQDPSTIETPDQQK